MCIVVQLKKESAIKIKGLWERRVLHVAAWRVWGCRGCVPGAGVTLYRPGDSFSHSLLPGAHGGRSASRPLVSKAFLKCRAREGTASCRCDMGGIIQGTYPSELTSLAGSLLSGARSHLEPLKSSFSTKAEAAAFGVCPLLGDQTAL